MSAGWFPLDDECEPSLRRFLSALREHTRDWPPNLDPEESGAFLIDGLLITYVDVSDDDVPCVVETFRVDFDGSSVYADRVARGVSRWDGHRPRRRGQPRVLRRRGRALVPAASSGAAVERHEWFEGGERVHVRWKFAGESGWLVWSDRDNDPRDDRGDADRVVEVR